MVPREQGTFSLSAPSEGYQSHPNAVFFFLFFFFHTSWLCGDLSCSFGYIRDFLPVFRELFHMQMCFVVFVGGGKLHVLSLLSLDLPDRSL